MSMPIHFSLWTFSHYTMAPLYRYVSMLGNTSLYWQLLDMRMDSWWAIHRTVVYMKQFMLSPELLADTVRNAFVETMILGILTEIHAGGRL